MCGWGRDAPNIFKFSRELVKSAMLEERWPQRDVFFSLAIVGHLVKTPPPPTECLGTSLTQLRISKGLELG